MTTELNTHISQLLGVVERPSVATRLRTEHSLVGWAPRRPEPLYEYVLRVSRSEYGSMTVTAESATDAWECDLDDVEWYTAGDTSCDECEQESDDPVNSDEIDEWDEQYALTHDSDGQPKCSSCGDCVNSSSDLTRDPADDSQWYCLDCQ